MLKKKPVLLWGLVLLTATLASGAESPNITVFRPGVNPRDKNDVMVRAAEKYRKETGGKVTFVISDWVNWQSKILTYMAAGEPIDVIFARDADFPLFYTRGYVQPIDKYVNLNVPYINKTGMDLAFKYDGKYYVASHVTSNHPWIIIYNKTLMEEEGIPESEQPLALYKAGKWTWAKLRELAIKLTKDTTGSGKIDRWGFGNWWTRGFVYMNGTGFTVKDAKGNFKLNFDDQRLLEALQFLADAKKEGWYQQDYSMTSMGLQRRTIAMYMEREYFPVQIIQNTRDELAYVPLPRGPGNKEQVNIFECDGYAIGNGSKSPTYAGKFIDICLKEWYEEDLKGRQKWPKEIFPIVDEMAKKPYYPGPSNSVLDPMLDNFLGEIVWTGNSPAAAIAGYKAQAETLIAEAAKPFEKPVKLPFNPITVDFENGDISAFKVGKPEYKSVKLQIVSDSRAIKGKSLLISMDSKVDGEWIDAVFTDPEKVGIVGWRNYTISFDIKPLKMPTQPDGYLYFQVWQDSLRNWGWTTQKIDAANQVYTVKVNIKDVLANGKFPLKFGGRFAGDFVIDNISIQEKK
ncbi:extracellular solute-binding protein [Treponema sp. J25]|uniref:ABC transporter substrate-binding protein n=1 Tax=Treponema sp. J25 TaxID=2094121 RepID=UPI00104A28E2|nr:extracellular solute-binding protein [Treponema sp. J25]TCW61209.1 ABC transporter substrate-binding protein [Treponema sp. J25]